MNTGITIIKEFESCSPNAYQCPAGVWTIGWGHTGGVQPEHTITRGRAEELLDSDVDVVSKGIEKLVTVPLNANEFGALTSLVFNIGINAFKNSTLLKLLNASQYTVAAEQFLRWNKIKTVESKGLTRRRIAERKLFLTPI